MRHGYKFLSSVRGFRCLPVRLDARTALSLSSGHLGFCEENHRLKFFFRHHEKIQRPLNEGEGVFQQLLKSGRDVGFLEIVAFVEQWFTAGLGQGIGEAVSVIEAGGVPSLAKVCKPAGREPTLLLPVRW